jgi:hypothetical protein
MQIIDSIAFTGIAAGSTPASSTILTMQIQHLSHVGCDFVFPNAPFLGFLYLKFRKNGANPNQQQKKTITNAVVKIVRIEEELSAWVDYTYDPMGNLIKLDVNEIITTISYNSLEGCINALSRHHFK